MYRSDLFTDITVLRPDLFENISGSSNTCMQESIHEDMISPPEYPTADSDVPMFNTGNDPAFTPAATTSMGSFIAQSKYTYPGCEALFSANSLATQSVSDPRGMGTPPHVVNLTAGTPFTNAMPSSSPGYSSEAGVGVPGYPMERTAAWSIPGNVVADVAAATNGQMIWVEGSVEDVAHRTGGTVQHQEEAQQEYFAIPRSLRLGFRALLAATQDDWACGTVRKIRCRLCPDIEFKKWRYFMRHCKYSETHPLEICFCDYCGDYFGRNDARQRHCNHRPAKCLRVAPKKADEKRRTTQRAHKKYIERLGEGGTERFSQIMKEKFPDSSKRP